MIREIKQCELIVLRDDPVRPYISDRIGKYRKVLVLDDLSAVVCASITNTVPSDEVELFCREGGNVVVFYTLWSYKKGAGKQIVREALAWVEKNCPFVDRAVTFSPKTDMARNFHLGNGATLLRENEDSINYEYTLKRIAEWV